MLRRVEGRAPLNGDHRAARTGHPGPHSIKEPLEIHDLRLPGGSHNGGQPLGPAGGQHGVLRGPHAGDGQAQLPARQPLPLGAGQPPLLLRDLRPQPPQGSQVEIDGPGPQLTASRIGQLRPAQPGQQRPQKDHRGAHLPHQPVGDPAAGQLGRVYQNGVPLPDGPAPQQAQDLQGGGHVGQVGTVALARGQKGSGQNGQGAVFGSLHPQLPPEGPSAADLIKTHGIASVFWLDSGYPMPTGVIWSAGSP